ncbi:hypothetical protein L228DRAFT_268023 [Xylona heveae TC161]|uniref:MEI5 protein n=1 Tax=Xylona heveae (strain CBS 132557 / TC161) TaxID=1328760 RepID=A0A165GV48_XYLHT|nr:hypothetical protein L228DRAFT_268023 [Xylona heveae TC161]KZF22634.1 hypothetical protein L228DRAFT_268023 [Xylona heveae TC161]
MPSNRHAESLPPGKWNAFVTATKEILAYSPYLSDVEKAGDNISSLRQQLAKMQQDLKEKQRELDEANAVRSRLHDDYDSRYSTWRVREAELQDELQETHSRAQTIRANEVQDLQTQLMTNKGALDQTRQQLQEAQTLLVNYRAQIKDSKDLAESRERALGLTDLDEDFEHELEQLSQQLYKLSQRYFARDLPQEANRDDVYQRLWQSSFMSVFSGPIAISNSSASKHMRAAAVESLIANELVKSIFQDPSVVRQGRVPRDLLDRLAHHPLQEGVMRSLILKAYAFEETQARVQSVRRATTDVLGMAAPLLSDTDRDLFARDLSAYLETTADLWERRLRSEEDISVSINLRQENTTWRMRGESPEGDPSDGAAPIMVLFPRICRERDQKLLCEGVALWSDQPFVNAAQIEAQAQATRIPATLKISRGASVASRRRQSTSMPSESSNNRDVARSSAGSTSPTDRTFAGRANRAKKDGSTA